MKAQDCTDLGNADRFVAEHADRIRFVGAWRKAVVWDGKRWALDVTGSAEHLAKQTVRGVFTEANKTFAAASDALARAKADDNAELAKLQEARLQEAQKAHAWALKSHEARRIAAIVQLARSAPELAIKHDALDADPWLLNVANGTIDLRTGALRPHNPDDLITKLAPVAFDPAAKCPTWDAFLERAMGGHAELVDFVRRITGYAITGVIREHVLGFHMGGGANGKSTYLGTMHAALGEYATRAPRGLLFRARGERHETELTTLFGARFVSCAEIQQDDVFDEALVKDLTGGDQMTARRMREDHWSWNPTHKLFLAGNHKPRVRGSDEGIWRRIRLVPWVVTIPEGERDPELPAKLRSELPGILAWAVRGCLEWQEQGLGVPPAVVDATSAYREESDPLREFFELHCIFEPGAVIARKHLREAYEAYCRENGAEALGAKRFAEGLRRRNVIDATKREGTKVLDAWRGVRLATDQEREQPQARRGEGTCGDQFSGNCDLRARVRHSTGFQKNSSLRPYGEELFSDFLEREGVHAEGLT